MRVAPRCMGKNKRGKRSEARTQARQERGRDRSRKRQLNDTSKEIQVIRENLKKKIGEVKPELKTETKKEEQAVVDEFAFIDYGGDGDSGADAAVSCSSDRSDGETGATSSNTRHGPSPKHRAREQATGQRDRSRRPEKRCPQTRTPVELKPRRW